MNKKLVSFFATALGMAAIIFVTTACAGAVGHRPALPAELLKK